ncbi:phospholipase D family protein [Aeromonas jandaei]|uniref:phospholipase D family protein n=1 Tax=Aeromonas TaxID=642 RepID=UPI001C234098|nr:phospholipase D family protein [Aeromonas sp. FDAARGOS 1410]QXC38408.1 phospholipase D family protein [Aeromonas sp. FDAARGOS 1410]
MIPGSFALIDNPALALKVRCHWIRSAREQIQAQYYSWEEDSSGKLLLGELLHAARRGVRVQLLVDDLYAGDNRFLEMVAHCPGIEVRLFNPFWLRGWRPLALLLEGLFTFRRINHRMHNKLLLVDGKLALIGGRNIGDRYFGLDPDAPFVDLDLACQGAICEQMAAGFTQFWQSRWSHPIRHLLRRRLQPAEIRVVNDFLLTMADPAVAAAYDLPASLFDGNEPALAWHTGRAEVWFDRPGKGLVSRPVTARQLWRQLAEAPSTLRMVTPYLILTGGFRRRLQRLRRQGVVIEILTNSLASTDVPLVHGAYQRHRGWLLRQGIRLCEFDEGHSSLHAKLILLGEDRALFGSLNLDPRSLFLNTELMLQLECAPICQQLQAWLLQWQGQGEPRKAEGWSRRLVARLSNWLPLHRWL